MEPSVAEHSKRYELLPHPGGPMRVAEPLHHERYDPIMDGMYRHDGQGSGQLTAEELEIQRRKRYGRPPGAKDKKPRRRRTKAQMEEDALLYGVRPEDDAWNSIGSKRRSPPAGHFWDQPQQWNRHQLPLQARPPGYQTHPGIMPHHPENLPQHQQLHHHHHHPPPQLHHHNHHSQQQQQQYQQPPHLQPQRHLPALPFPSQHHQQQHWGRRSTSPTIGSRPSNFHNFSWNTSPIERRGSESEGSASVESSRASLATSTAYSTSSDSRLKESQHGQYPRPQPASVASRRTTPSLKDLLNDSDDVAPTNRPHQRSVTLQTATEFGRLKVGDERDAERSPTRILGTRGQG